MLNHLVPQLIQARYSLKFEIFYLPKIYQSPGVGGHKLYNGPFSWRHAQDF